MASLDPGNVRRKLSNKFGFVDTGGTNHDRFLLTVDGEKVAYVDVGRHKDPLGDPLLKSMADQAGVRRAEFIEMIRCTISSDKYRTMLGLSQDPPSA